MFLTLRRNIWCLAYLPMRWAMQGVQKFYYFFEKEEYISHGTHYTTNYNHDFLPSSSWYSQFIWFYIYLLPKHHVRWQRSLWFGSNFYFIFLLPSYFLKLRWGVLSQMPVLSNAVGGILIGLVCYSLYVNIRNASGSLHLDFKIFCLCFSIWFSHVFRALSFFLYNL